MSDAKKLEAEVARLQAKVDAQALELIAARSNIADLTGVLSNIGNRVAAALKA